MFLRSITKQLLATELNKKHKSELILRIEGVWTPLTTRNCGEIIKTNFITHPKFKKLFSIYLEMVYNVMLHGSQKERHGTKEYGIGTFELWEHENTFVFITKNPISRRNANNIVERCNHINSLEKEELITFYRAQRKKSAEENRKGVNIGLIDIVRKSKNPIKITSLEYTPTYIELEIEATINI